jgi:phosphohistidine phosphatase
MKLLTLLRHGKSEWETGAENDFDRPLRDRGRRDAPFMGKYFAALELQPDLIASSRALRAAQTAELFAQAAGYAKPIHWEDNMYAASAGELMSVLRSLPGNASHVLLVGHNPGFEDLAAQLIGASTFGMVAGLRLPTAAAAHIELGIERWVEVQTNSGRLLWLVNPRILQAVK